MPFKSENLEVWKLALEYIDLIYEIASQLPRSEEYNLKLQMTRAATSVALNIHHPSTDSQIRPWSFVLRPVLRREHP